MVVVIGGGISGLSVAWFLHTHNIPVRVLEARDQPGGAILTSCKQNYRVEHGPNSTLQKPGHPDDALGRLIQQLQLEPHLQVANPLASRRYILRDGQLKALPGSPPAFFLSSFFSWHAKLQLLAEPFRAPGTEEESIAQFVRRRLGEEFFQYVIDPFISGVYAGDPEQLSVQAAVAKIYALERDHGSLLRGALHQGRVLKGAGLPKGRMISFDQGMGLLPTRIAQQLPEGALRSRFKVLSLVPNRQGGGWQIYGVNVLPDGRVAGKTEKMLAKAVVLSVPAPAAAQLVAPFAKIAVSALRAIPYAPIASIALGYSRALIPHPLDGFGFLIPRREGLPLLGTLFSSTLFKDRAPEGQALLTSFIGGATQPALLQQTDGQLIRQVEQDLGHCLGMMPPVDFVYLTRYSAAIPQYTLGHLQRIQQVDADLAPFPGLYLRANWRDGISVADCVRNGEKVAEHIAADYANLFVHKRSRNTGAAVAT
ncbi:protoporphyrinogen oxidase [Candidatus Magnetaquicoccus inordinatus]|uniref:protoporphyrinogen oxidase n=1 Tax=Candidatus Magnetaquicoccus inordinatus TaxID=2496818 RepID=UPI00102BC2F1|nr:protoporphyrinogen oxidase [Candidatus Magnetaquicoccus inordinatus]